MTANLNNSPLLKPQKSLPSYNTLEKTSVGPTTQKSNLTQANLENRRISPTGASSNSTTNNNSKLFTPIQANNSANSIPATSPTPSQTSSTGMFDGIFDIGQLKLLCSLFFYL